MLDAQPNSACPAVYTRIGARVVQRDGSENCRGVSYCEPELCFACTLGPWAYCSEFPPLTVGTLVAWYSGTALYYANPRLKLYRAV